MVFLLFRHDLLHDPLRSDHKRLNHLVFDQRKAGDVLAQQVLGLVFIGLLLELLVVFSHHLLG
jgi:hypothetical protein